MWRNRILTSALTGSVLLTAVLVWGIVLGAPPAAKDSAKKNKKADAAADEETMDKSDDTASKSKSKTAKSKAKSSTSDSKQADDESASDSDKHEKVVKTDAEWRKILTAPQFRVARKKHTELPGSGIYAHSKKDGVYHCVCCGEPLFDSTTKFESGTGWPSFFQAIEDKAITELPDTTENMVRTEVQCSRCDAHLGHVFPDGPQPTGLRYCTNSASLKFVPRGKELPAKDAKSAKAAPGKTTPIKTAPGKTVKKGPPEKTTDSKASE